MSIQSKKEGIILLVGDAVFFVASLWLALSLRRTAVSYESFLKHLSPFLLVFMASIFVFFIAGLYEKHTLLLKSKLPTRIFNAQLANTLIAVLIFYLVPYFGITPKTTLFLYLVISFVILVGWRLYGHMLFGLGKKQKGLLIASGEEMHELFKEVNGNNRYSLHFDSALDLNKLEGVDFQKEIVERVYAEDIHVIVIDAHNEKVEPILPHLYNLIFSSVKFIDMHKVYEDVFDKVPLSLVEDSWFIENISSTSRTIYDGLKRIMDVVASFVLGALSLLFYPFIILAIKFEDGGDIFIRQMRMGEGNRLFTLIKFRTMSGSDEGEEVLNSKNKITKVGSFLRKSRLDELPQLWSVLKGNLSLIGPRPELPELVREYDRAVPYYDVRHIIKPGLSGWAQLYHDAHPHHGVDVKETRRKLSYDLFYIKNRSFFLDIKIALKTIAKMVSQSGR